jgi:hypothetical protein
MLEFGDVRQSQPDFGRTVPDSGLDLARTVGSHAV